MNKVAKGRIYENLAKSTLQGEGYIVDQKPLKKFHSPDFFGQFDLMAIKGNEIKYVQVKSNISHFYSAKKKIRKWMEDNELFLNAEVWYPVTDYEWRREKVDINNTKIVEEVLGRGETYKG